MKALVVEEKGKYLLKDVPVPAPKDDEVLVKVKAAGICGTDMHIIDGGFTAVYPVVPGHEFAGQVVEKGKSVKGVNIGDRVAVHPNIYCRKCHFCRTSKFNQCLNIVSYGVHTSGGFQEYTAVKEENAYLIGNMDYEEGALAEPLSCVLYGYDMVKPVYGCEALVFGCGTIGLLHLQVLKNIGASRIVMVDISERKMGIAGKMGAFCTLKYGGSLKNELCEIAPLGFDLVVDATGVAGVVEEMTSYVKNSGTLFYFGVCEQDKMIKISPYEVFKRDLRIMGSFSLRYDFDTAVRYIRNGRIDVKSIISDRFALDDIVEAFKFVQNRSNLFKTIIVEKL